MSAIKDYFIKNFNKNKSMLVTCIIFTYGWGMLAHGSMFLQNAFAHDSLNEFNANIFGDTWKLQLGRIFVPAYRWLTRSVLTLPWLIGFLSLLWISISVFLLVRSFKIQSKVQIFLIAAIMTTNLSVTATVASYMHDFDCNMFALLMAVVAVYLWNKYKYGFIFGMPVLGISLGIYQSYVSVTITLIFIVTIVMLLNYEKFACVMIKGIKGIVMLIGGAGVYLVSLKMSSYITGVSLISGKYNSLDKALTLSIIDLVNLAFKGYRNSINLILKATSVYPVKCVTILHCCIIVVVGIIIFAALLNKKIKVLEKILLLSLIFVMPFGLNVSYILSNGMSHDLMHYALWLVYLLAILVVWRSAVNFEKWKERLHYIARSIAVAVILVIMWGNVQTSNTTYLKRIQEHEATLSLFTRIMYMIETYEGYIPGETPVVFVGKSNGLLSRIPGFESTDQITGQNYPVLGPADRSYYVAYFDYVLLNPIRIADETTWNSLKSDEAVKNMPCYPQKECIQMKDGILVIKLS